MTVLRSGVFAVMFYLALAGTMIVALPSLLAPRAAVRAVVKTWARITDALLRVICGVRVEWRGLENIPEGAILVASKHQSAWETFSLVPPFADPCYVLKQELTRLPLYGWFVRRTGGIPVDREGGRAALIAMVREAQSRVDARRQIIIFPEGTRSAPGAPPDYKSGIAFLYSELGVPCLPVALNSGLFWPRRSMLRRPGTIVVEFLKPIPAQLDRRTFMRRLEHDIETATARLVAEGERQLVASGHAPATASLGRDPA